MKSEKIGALFSVYFFTISFGVVITAPANAADQEKDSELLLTAARLNKLLTEDKISTIKNGHISRYTNTAKDDMNDVKPSEVEDYKKRLKGFKAALVLRNEMQKAFTHRSLPGNIGDSLERLKRSNRRNVFKRLGLQTRKTLDLFRKGIKQKECIVEDLYECLEHRTNRVKRSNWWWNAEGCPTCTKLIGQKPCCVNNPADDKEPPSSL